MLAVKHGPYDNRKGCICLYRINLSHSDHEGYNKHDDGQWHQSGIFEEDISDYCVAG